MLAGCASGEAIEYVLFSEDRSVVCKRPVFFTIFNVTVSLEHSMEGF